jgi:hypothetical protein
MIKMPLTCMVRVDAYDQSSICTCTSSEDYLRCRVRVDPPCVGTRQQFRKEHERKPLYTMRKCCGWDTFLRSVWLPMETAELPRWNRGEDWRTAKSINVLQAGAQCVAAEVHPPRTKLPKNVPPRTDMKYPTFMVMIANMLHGTSASDISMRCIFWNTYSK